MLALPAIFPLDLDMLVETHPTCSAAVILRDSLCGNNAVKLSWTIRAKETVTCHSLGLLTNGKIQLINHAVSFLSLNPPYHLANRYQSFIFVAQTIIIYHQKKHM